MIFKNVSIERLMSKVEMIPICGCWIFNGSLDNHGYGQMSTSFKQSPIKAHRASYMLHKGNIPKGLFVRHKCDVPACVNPEHLELGTHKQNMEDMKRRNRWNKSSALNLKPGRKGFRGAGPLSNKEISNGIGQ